jgi:hypothetical protein
MTDAFTRLAAEGFAVNAVPGHQLPTLGEGATLAKRISPVM